MHTKILGTKVTINTYSEALKKKKKKIYETLYNLSTYETTIISLLYNNILYKNK